MTEKLLEKNRNIFLSLTPPENLIAKKRVKESKKNRYQKNRIKNSGGSPGKTGPSYNATPFLGLFPEKGQRFKNPGETPSFTTHSTNGPILEKISLEEKNIIPPRDHSAVHKLHFTIGGNINQFLKTEEREKKTRKNKSYVPLEVHSEDIFPPFSRKLTNISPFYFAWNGGKNAFTSSLEEFIRGQYSKNIWSTLFSSYDLKSAYNSVAFGAKNYRSPVRIKNQHKNELLEYRKIALFYGNLSRNSLTNLIQRSGASKFLSTLEKRLDVLLKQALFFPSIRGARQWIHQGKILVNNDICIYNSYLVQPGDFISIKEEYKCLWKKEWSQNFKEFTPNVHVTNSPFTTALINTNSTQRNPSQRNTSNTSVSVPLAGPRGRFLFPPNVMRKWEIWCQLWGNSIFIRKNGHSWSKQPYSWNFSLHPFFNNSVCADNIYLKSFMQLRVHNVSHVSLLRYTHRQPTTILFWLQELHKNLFTKVKKSDNMYMYQFISSLLLLQQRGRVIDGLFPQRWSRLFTKKKSPRVKKRNCQWGGIKPMHLECSYSCATVIYLYTPQKLVWPSHINMSLLKSHLT